MQIGKDTTLRLTLVDDSAEDAEAIVSTLRNGGIAVRPLRPLDAGELGQMVASQPMDLLLASRTAKGIPLATVLAQVDGSGKDIPVIVLADAITETDLLADQAAGARAVALRGRPDHVLTVLRREWADLDARRSQRRLEGQMRETERRCDALISSSRDPIAYIHEGMHIRANDAYLEMFGFESFEDVEGLSLLDLVGPQYVSDFKALLKKLSKGEPPPPRFELEARSLDGDSFPATLEFATATYEGEPCVQVVFRRREEFDPELAREVEDLRQRDMVTGLLNRPTFLRELETAVAAVARGEDQYGLLLVEPDHYQRLLADIGIDSADDLAAALAARLSEKLDDSCIAARFGERTFAVLLRGNHAHTAALAEKLRAAYASHVFNVGERSASVTASLGGVQIGEKIASVGPVLTRATDCLQAATNLGGNRFEIFDPGAVDRAEEERVQNWIQRLREALQDDSFRLHYQPVVSLQAEPGEVYEALLRLESNGEIVQPQSFIGIAEDNGLLDAIDRWVVNRAIEVLAERKRNGHDTRMVVKVSPASFADNRLLDLIARQLAAHDVPGDRLWLQTPEAKVFTHLRQAQAFQTAAAKLGCHVGLEHFGAGLDSFQLLSHFQPTFLKIDRVFSEDLGRNAEHQQKIREIAERAQALGIVTVAEHVQDAATMAFLFTANVDYVEGNFLAAPGPLMNYDFS
ncbi:MULTISPECIES: EAL domain-containing protein [Pseudoxanthomonas]|jgi:diguanylate cyclase (GGDEF)-like protein/PAS domain S-box-containing protein|uniref:EAL domain-containing protein n=1 Tax=Pseudoxanthomonas mexicana TaxID=128785 RepID=A0ABX6RCU6_PSEMX|nr:MULTISPECIES: bifunctional diguanylate cyclase/phosphodiesterase [Pseudoxanthomonas]MCH2092000.1 bifunctional diguanylate cyclase/phosphodiesterase [Pseudoxanthomonas sp.]QLQ29500.1 MAG: EAL domain-containing protein [Pseudoxanthomonas sp.]QND80661.1 EAL domain-containing protein [Pseudoxanthomonas mexicana]